MPLGLSLARGTVSDAAGADAVDDASEASDGAGAPATRAKKADHASKRYILRLLFRY